MARLVKPRQGFNTLTIGDSNGGVIISYNFDIVAENYGYNSGKDAVLYISSNLTHANSSGLFLAKLKDSGSPVLSSVSTTSISSISSLITYIHSPSPTRQPTNSPDLFYTSFPVYGQALFIIGGVLCLFILLYLLIIIVFKRCNVKPVETPRAHDSPSISHETNHQYNGLPASQAHSSPDHVVIEMNP
jgi:hypothetical protein